MDVVYERCCGLDVHQKTVVACVVTPGEGGTPRKAVRTSGTMTGELLALGDWLAEQGITHVALESTGVYWQPIRNLLEERFELLLVNARHGKAVPGRKTDVRDCEWLADLLRHGLLRGSVVPARPQRELRELTRYRTSLIQERTAHVNRLHKTLEGANLKLAAVATDVTGVSARRMLEALAAGEADPAALADLAVGRLRDKLPQLERALAGRFGAHRRYLVPRILAAIDFLDAEIADLGARIAELERPFEAAVARPDEIPGVGRRVAEIILAELGPAAPPLPERRAPSLLGRAVPRQRRERRQAAERPDAQGQHGPPDGADRSRSGRRPHRHLPRSAVPAPGAAPRQEEGRRRHRPQHPGDRLPPAHLPGAIP